MPRSVAELLPSIPLATTSQDGLAAATQIATLEALDTDDAGATFTPTAVALDATRAYDDYVQSGAIQLALSGATHVAGSTATVRVTGNGAAVTVDGVTVFWADGEAGAKTWSDQRTLALWYHPGLGAALAIVPGDGGGSGDMLAATYDPQAKNADAFARSNHTGTQAISTVTGLQTELDTKLTPTTAQIIQTATFGSGAVTCNLALGSKFAVTINGAWNAGSPLLGTNPPSAGQARTVELVTTISGTQTVTLTGLPWLGDPPSLTTASGDVIVLVATWEGSTLVDVVGANRA